MEATQWIVQLDTHSPRPAYRQIVDAIRTVLVGGGAAPGEKLPTVRELAQQLGVHHNTVAQAYRVLAHEGFLRLRRHAGAEVLERPDPQAQPGALHVYCRQLRELTAKAIADGAPLDDVAVQLVALGHALQEA